jgi:hypothetical protein
MAPDIFGCEAGDSEDRRPTPYDAAWGMSKDESTPNQRRSLAPPRQHLQLHNPGQVNQGTWSIYDENIFLHCSH